MKGHTIDTIHKIKIKQNDEQKLCLGEAQFFLELRPEINVSCVFPKWDIVLLHRDNVTTNISKIKQCKFD